MIKNLVILKISSCLAIGFYLVLIFTCGSASDNCEKLFYENGDLKSVGCFNQGMKEGRWVSFYRNNGVAEAGFYKQNHKEDLWNGWFRNGHQAYQGFFKNNIPDSLWSFYFKNGCIRSYGKMRNGYMVGKWIDFHVNGDSSYRFERGDIQRLIPIDMEYSTHFESSNLRCDKRNPEILINVDSLIRDSR